MRDDLEDDGSVYDSLPGMSFLKTHTSLDGEKRKRAHLPVHSFILKQSKQVDFACLSFAGLSIAGFQIQANISVPTGVLFL